jgi:hypothetical protein
MGIKERGRELERNRMMIILPGSYCAKDGASTKRVIERRNS